MTKPNVEELLFQANPVADAEQMRLPSDEMEARCASILERRDVMTAPTSSPERLVRSPRTRPRFQPALAFAIGLFVVLGAVGGVVAWTGGGSSLVDEPVATAIPQTTNPPPPTTALPTTAAPALDGRIATLAYAGVPSFSGTVQYYEHDPAFGDPGWQATVQIRHAGPMAFEATVLEESGEFVPLGGAGTVFFGDGSDVWVLEGGYRGPFPMPLEPFRHVFFDGERWASAWDDICGTAPTELGVESIAGRSTTHVTCSTDLEDYELWVDEETGLVMRMSGPLAIGDYSPYLARDGLFEFTEIVFEPVATPDPPEPATAGSDLDVPPLHMIRTSAEPSGQDWVETETWYFDGRTQRETTIDAADPSLVGSFFFADGRRAGVCDHSVGYCDVWGDTPEGETFPLFGQLPEELVAENCSETPGATVAARPARHYVCDNIWFEDRDGWRVIADARASTWEYWFDVETGLRVKVVSEYEDWEVTLLEINPQFPAGVFDYREPDWVEAPFQLAVGDVAPPWSGPLVGGGSFDMAEQAGKYVVVYSWFPHYAVAGLDFLHELQLLSDTYSSESLTFVTVSGDTLAETQNVLDRMGITVPTVHCGYDPDQVCFPQEPWVLWGTGLTVTVIDPDGVVVAVFPQLPFDDELEQLLGDISN